MAGDSCFGGVNHEPIQMACPGSSLFTKQNLIILTGLLIIVLIYFIFSVNSTEGKPSLSSIIISLFTSKTNEEKKIDHKYKFLN